MEENKRQSNATGGGLSFAGSQMMGSGAGMFNTITPGQQTGGAMAGQSTMFGGSLNSRNHKAATVAKLIEKGHN